MCFMLLASWGVAQEANNLVLRVESAACRYVTQHVPDADVDYKPGVDVRGKNVVPADTVPPMDMGLEDSFNLRLTTDAVKAFGLKVPMIHSTLAGSDPNASSVTTDTSYGTITLTHGKPFLNGKPLDPAAQSHLAIACKSWQAE